ncbi:MAG: M48 family metallopeptidase [Tannerella sp.]|jgi:predicted metal-dependent hydrolase|nr:M48 family metallopeptidase [Tannerella sp.]
MNTLKEVDGGDLGTIFVKYNVRAKRYTLRVYKGQVYATIPRGGNEKDMMTFVGEQREYLHKLMKERPARQLLDENSEFRAFTFSLSITRNELNHNYAAVKDGVLHISCEKDTDFSDLRTQDMLWGVITNALRLEAKRYLPQRLKMLAEKHGFQYSAVKINNSRTHWGSCGSKKSINLSLSLMQLPEHLIDYVLLHELCHTVEMNHSERFLALMDKVTGGKTDELRSELKNNYKML